MKRRKKKAFADDLLAEYGGETGIEPQAGLAHKFGESQRSWKHVRSKSSTVDLAGEVGTSDFAVGYAWAEIVLSEKRSATLGLGSDDGIKVWLNGKLVHENWVARAVRTDDDLVPLELAAGKNRLLLKVQNARGAWGFTCRLIDKSMLTDRFVRAAVAGEVDSMRRMVAAGVDVNARSKVGLTALAAAKIYGQTEAAELPPLPQRRRTSRPASAGTGGRSNPRAGHAGRFAGGRRPRGARREDSLPKRIRLRQPRTSRAGYAGDQVPHRFD